MCSEICLRWGNISSFQRGDDFPLFLSIFPAASWHRQELHSTPQNIATQWCVECQEFLREPKGGGGSTVLANLQLEAIKKHWFYLDCDRQNYFYFSPFIFEGSSLLCQAFAKDVQNTSQWIQGAPPASPVRLTDLSLSLSPSLGPQPGKLCSLLSGRIWRCLSAVKCRPDSGEPSALTGY